jgi:hypothetical protein
MNISPTQSQIQQALASFLGAVLSGTSGVPAPAVFVGSINGTTLTVNPLPGVQPAGIQGTIQINAPIMGAGVLPGTFVVQQLTGNSGGTGTYQLNQPQVLARDTLSTGVSVVAGQANRVVEPANPYFVVMTPIRSPRLSTNLDSNADCKLTGSISGTVMTVTAVAQGTINPGASIIGTGVALNTRVVQQLTGSAGGTETYSVSISQNLASGTLSAGQMTLLQDSEWVIQCDFHAADNTAGDFAKTVSTALRDNFGVSFFAALTAPLNAVVPLYADDPVQTPFISGEEQFEWRFTLDVHLEVAQVLSVPQTYADAVSVELIELP